MEPCPIIQFARETIHDNDGDLYKTMTESKLLQDFRKTAAVELAWMKSRPSQHQPGNEVPEGNWVYRFAKKNWFFGFGAYT